MARLRQNFQSGTITDNPLAIGATTFNSAALANLVAVVAPDILAITLDPAAVNGDPEIVHVTAHTALATSATITRAQEGSVARAHPLATAWEHNITEDDFDYNNLDNLPVLAGLKSITYIAQGTTTYNTPAGITAILVEGIASGGGGGGAATAVVSAAAGAGGGEGATSRVLILNPDASYPCVVGAGGAGGAAGANPGSAGTDTTFGSPSVCTAKAGGGGNGMAAGTAVFTVQAAHGGASATGVGDIKLGGDAGSPGIRLSGTVAVAGKGGGRGMSGAVGAGAGGAGREFGGGGAGGVVVNGSAAVAGGDGANGIIVVYEYGA